MRASSKQPLLAGGWETYRRLLRYVFAYKGTFLLALLGMVVAAATETGFAALMKPLLDGTFVEKDPEVIRIIPFALLGIAVLRGIAGFAASFGMSWVARNVIRDLRGQMFREMLRKPVSYFDSMAAGQLISKLIYDVEQVASASTQVVTVLVRDVFTIAGLLGWMIYLNASLVLVLAVVGPVVVVTVRFASKRFRLLSRRVQSSMGDVGSAANEAVQGQRVIKIFRGEEYENQHFRKVNEYNRRQNLKHDATRFVNVSVVEFLVAVAIASVVYIATLPGMLEDITAGTFMSFIAAMSLLVQPAKRLTTINAALQRGIVASQSIFSLLDAEPERDTGTRVLGRVRGEVEFRNVSFSYPSSDEPVLRDISFRTAAGRMIALVGRSGSGKSTLVSLLPRFYDPDSGVILVDGQNIRDCTLASLRDQIALVSQDVVLFDDTVAGNIAYSRRGKASEREILEAAEAAHAMEFISRMPQGLETRVGENGALLSGGQRQRIAIARAFLKDAPILILDEATSALDSETEQHIQVALDRLMQSRTTLVIAHRLSTIERADTILVMEGGAIVEQGSHAELLARGGHYTRLYQMQFREPERQ
ncbi:MAG TPA: lipid A export permease/ATP-binding protein MsbA [Gammaproteobacteria bacterium]|nr:lipid A export permease/ATP-binding protein MsbA [Gammaproteobacteria bacterium]